MNVTNKNRHLLDGEKARQAMTVFFACLLVVSMMVSPFLLSISMWGLVAAALWQSAATYRAEGRWGDFRHITTWFEILARSFHNLFRQPPLALLALLLAVPALSFFWSADQGYWLERTRVRIPFLVLPWVFANLPGLSERQFRAVLYVLFWALTIICLGAAANFMIYFDEIMDGIGRGQPVPVPRNHIRFSLILAVGILSGGWLWMDKWYWRYRWERWALGLAVVFLFFFIHVLSVRSGLMGLYAALLFSIGWYLWQTRRWVVGVAALLIVVATPIVAMKIAPSFQMRINYMLWDWKQFQQNTGGEYSDSQRLISLYAGLQLWQENPVLGVGAGDLPAEVQRVIKERYPGYGEAAKLPHNQFVYILAGTGLFGLLLSAIAFFAPATMGLHRHSYLFTAFQVLVFASFLVEYTIETSIGVAFYLFYTLWFMQMSKK